jgi:hypothetical protein
VIVRGQSAPGAYPGGTGGHGRNPPRISGTCRAAGAGVIVRRGDFGDFQRTRRGSAHHCAMDNEERPWTVGQLRDALDGLHDDLVVVLNIPVRIPGQAGTTRYPLAIVAAQVQTVDSLHALPARVGVERFVVEADEPSDTLIYVPGSI